MAESWATGAQEVLAANGFASGAARRAVLELLDGQRCGVSALEIEDALRESGRPVARASIYRILDELERLSLVTRLQVGGAMARFEASRSGAGHHHHLVCDRCGAVMPFSDPGLERAIHELCARVPMEVAEHEIVLRGACRACQA